MNLLLIESTELEADGRVCLCDGRAQHLIEVLKAAPGQEVRVGVLDGPTGVARVAGVENGTVTLVCALATIPPVPAVDLLLALPRPKVLRRLWAQLAALGVRRVMLTNAERVERNYFDTHVLEPRGYRPLLVEGLQQARDTHVPRVSVHRQFRVLVEDELDQLTGTALRLVADPAASTAIADSIAGAASSRVVLAVGPEGGWNGFELDLLREHRFNSVGLGPRTLRSDTACIALLALVHAALGNRG